MKIAYISDIHLDMYRHVNLSDLYSHAWDVLVVAGDTGSLGQLEMTIDMLMDDFRDKHIIFILGNHEFYNWGTSVVQGEIDAKKFIDADFHPHIHILTAGESVTIDDVTFIGATLWSDLGNEVSVELNDSVKDRVNNSISDFILIESGRFTPSDCMALFYRDMGGIIRSLNDAEDLSKVVVITHFSPTLSFRNNQFPVDEIAYYFSANMDDVIDEYQPLIWISGHTHGDNEDLMIGNTKLVSNQFHKDIHNPKPKFLDV